MGNDRTHTQPPDGAVERAALDLLVEQIGDVVWTATPDGSRVLNMSSGASRLYGVPAQTLRDNPALWLELVHPEDRPAVLRASESLPIVGEIVLTYRIVRADGSVRWISDRRRALLDRGGKVVGVGGIARDITAVKLAERALRLTQFAIDRAADAAFIVRRDARILYANDAAAELLGWRREELLKRRLTELDPERPEDTWHEHTERLGPDGSEVRLTTLRTNSGASRPVEMATSAMEFDNERYLCVFARDAQQRDLATQERDRLFRLSLDMLCIIGLDGRIRRANPALERALGRPGEVIVGRALAEFVHPDDRAAMEQQFAAMAGGRDMVDFEARCVGGGGETKIITWRATPLAAEGVVYAVGRDITAKKRADLLERERNSLRDAAKAMERVIGVVSHELRTPLAAVRMMAELLQSDAGADEATRREYLGAIGREIQSLSTMVNNLLEAARMNSGRAQWSWGEARLADVCDDAMRLLRPIADEKGLELTHGVEPAGLAVRCDASALRRLLVNLVSNACRHTQRGGVRVWARPCAGEGGRWFELGVADTGEGIAPEIVEKLGTPFALGAGIIGEAHVSGSGLGLAICKGIAAAHGGRIRVRTREGEGTTFTVRMRADLPGAADIREEPTILGEAA